jgi:hypothetical protein
MPSTGENVERGALKIRVERGDVVVVPHFLVKW